MKKKDSLRISSPSLPTPINNEWSLREYIVFLMKSKTELKLNFVVDFRCQEVIKSFVPLLSE